MTTAEEEKSVLEVTDYFGTIVKFKQKNYDKHKDKHPELRNKQFFPKQITMALQRPTLTIDGNQEGTLCYRTYILDTTTSVSYNLRYG